MCSRIVYSWQRPKFVTLLPFYLQFSLVFSKIELKITFFLACIHYKIFAYITLQQVYAIKLYLFMEINGTPYFFFKILTHCTNHFSWSTFKRSSFPYVTRTVVGSCSVFTSVGHDWNNTNWTKLSPLKNKLKLNAYIVTGNENICLTCIPNDWIPNNKIILVTTIGIHWTSTHYLVPINTYNH